MPGRSVCLKKCVPNYFHDVICAFKDIVIPETQHSKALRI